LLVVFIFERESTILDHLSRVCYVMPWINEPELGPILTKTRRPLEAMITMQTKL
jgi:hypothetical protein